MTHKPKTNKQLVVDITAKERSKDTTRDVVLNAFNVARKRSKTGTVKNVYFSSDTLWVMHEFFEDDDWDVKSNCCFLWEAEVILAEDYPQNKLAVLY